MDIYETEPEDANSSELQTLFFLNNGNTQQNNEVISNKLYIFGSINEEKAFETIIVLHNMIEKLRMYKLTNPEDFEEKFENRIYVNLSTCGGIAWDAFSIYQALKEASNEFEIVIHCYGKIMSAGLLILSAGDERISSNGTTFMLHEVGTSMSGQLSSLNNEMEDIKRLSRSFFDTIEKEFGSKLRDLIKPNLDYYFGVMKAKELNILTKILNNRSKK
jgi:ATP-dependent protease ClpP protease subunit